MNRHSTLVQDSGQIQSKYNFVYNGKFDPKEKVKKHEISAHEGKKSSGSSSQSGLDEKMPKIHEKKKLFLCHSCPAKFKAKINMMKHIDIVHERKKPNECPTCRIKFSTETSMVNHIAMVHENGKKPYECFLCVAKFSRELYLMGHMKQFHDDKRL